ncbi:MAG TPA: hypothetical protein VGG39_28540 [Polyangiaceae bacterium]
MTRALLLELIEACESCPELAARLARSLGAVGDVDQYSAANLPPRTTRRVFFSACRRGDVHGARRDGRGWACGRAAWEAYRARGALRPVRGVAHRDAKPGNVVDLDAMLRTGGLRGTR